MNAFGPDLGLAVWKWFRTDWPAWARTEARAHQSAHKWCMERLDKAGSKPPSAR